jgi:hypothetical protein
MLIDATRHSTTASGANATVALWCCAASACSLPTLSLAVATCTSWREKATTRTTMLMLFPLFLQIPLTLASSTIIRVSRSLCSVHLQVRAHQSKIMSNQKPSMPSRPRPRCSTGFTYMELVLFESAQVASPLLPSLLPLHLAYCGVAGVAAVRCKARAQLDSTPPAAHARRAS